MTEEQQAWMGLTPTERLVRVRARLKELLGGANVAGAEQTELEMLNGLEATWKRLAQVTAERDEALAALADAEARCDRLQFDIEAATRREDRAAATLSGVLLAAKAHGGHLELAAEHDL